jgi:hypothetical protein
MASRTKVARFIPSREDGIAAEKSAADAAWIAMSAHGRTAAPGEACDPQASIPSVWARVSYNFGLWALPLRTNDLWMGLGQTFEPVIGLTMEERSTRRSLSDDFGGRAGRRIAHNIPVIFQNSVARTGVIITQRHRVKTLTASQWARRGKIRPLLNVC